MENEEKSIYTDEFGELNEARVCNRTTAQILRGCKNVRTIDEFERDFMKELERMAKKYGLS